MKKILLFILFPVLFFYNCGSDSTVPNNDNKETENKEPDEEDDPANNTQGGATTEHFVIKYYRLDGIIVEYQEPYIIVYPDLRSWRIYSLSSKPEIYRELCDKHEDNGFYGRFSIVDREPGSYIDKDFIAITVTSEWEIAGFPPGTDLGWLISYYSLSPYQHIISGYEKTFDWDNYPLMDKFRELFPITMNSEDHWPSWGRENLFPNCGLLSQTYDENMILLGNGSFSEEYIEPLFILELNDPSLFMEHRLTLSVVTDEGIEFTTDIYIP